jgi:hypothetical protein
MTEKFELFDADGYPSEEALTKLRTWQNPKLHEVMGFVKDLWKWKDFVTESDGVYTLVTGGWSGNEDVISALMRNPIFWMFYWERSERGGLHVFSEMKL